MQLKIFRKFRYKLRRKIILRLKGRMERFEKISIKNKKRIYVQVKKVERRFAILDSTVETYGTPIAYLFLSVIPLFVIITPFYLPYRLGIQNPVITALICLIPFIVLSILIYSAVSYGKLRHIEAFADLPVTDKITNASKWVFASALITGISTALFPPVIVYVIITPIIIGVGSAVLFLLFEITAKLFLSRFVLDGFYKKYPTSTIIHMFVDVLVYFDKELSNNYLYKMEVAQLLGDTAEIMKKTLPPVFSRIDRTFFVFEITDPYLNKLIELRIVEMAMTLRVFAKMILLGDKSSVNYVQSKIEDIFIAILNGEWNKYEVEKSDELTKLLEAPPLSTKTERIFDKLKIIFFGLLPMGVLFSIQNTSYALPENIVENVMPFVATWALISVLNLIGSDDIIDRVLKVKSLVGSFGGSVK